MNASGNTPAVQQVKSNDGRSELSVDLEDLMGTDAAGLQAVILSLETKDPFTAAHQRRVSRLACAMAREMGTSDEDIRQISLAAAIHDLGKSCVPARILNKPGPLNDFEMNIMRGHPQLGHDMLKGIENRWPISGIVLQHHERLDGSGYPLGLRDEQILPHARLLAVADVFEAMISERAYRGPIPTAQVLAHLTENRGRLYDKQAVDVCVWLTTVKGFRFD